MSPADLITDLEIIEGKLAALRQAARKVPGTDTVEYLLWRVSDSVAAVMAACRNLEEL